MDEENDHWWDDWYGEDGLAEPPQWEPNQMFSEPLEQAGRHWKNVLIGDIFRTEWLDDSIFLKGRLEYLTATSSSGRSQQSLSLDTDPIIMFFPHEFEMIATVRPL